MAVFFIHTCVINKYILLEIVFCNSIRSLSALIKYLKKPSNQNYKKIQHPDASPRKLSESLFFKFYKPRQFSVKQGNNKIFLFIISN